MWNETDFSFLISSQVMLMLMLLVWDHTGYTARSLSRMATQVDSSSTCLYKEPNQGGVEGWGERADNYK